jgi:hypothetical protein
MHGGKLVKGVGAVTSSEINPNQGKISKVFIAMNIIRMVIIVIANKKMRAKLWISCCSVAAKTARIRRRESNFPAADWITMSTVKKSVRTIKRSKIFAS